MTAARLGRDLAAARRRGETFEDAWPAAVSRATAGQRTDERQAWSAALAATRGAWEAAWDGRPATRALRAVHALAVDDEREPLPEFGECARCAAALPPPRNGQARKWCSDGCRRQASRVALAA
jgi:hypothetical protein